MNGADLRPPLAAARWGYCERCTGWLFDTGWGEAGEERCPNCATRASVVERETEDGFVLDLTIEIPEGIEEPVF